MDRRLKKPIDSQSRQNLLNELGKLTEEYLSWGNIFCHRDYHSKNLMIIETAFAGPKVGVIDFQDALLAPLFYDLASLLRDSYVTLNEKLQSDLVENYRLRMKERKYLHTESKDAFRRAFDLMGTHRNLKAAGRFFFIDEVKKNPDYLRYVPRSLEYVKDTVERYEELKPLRPLLSSHFDELASACKH